MPAVFFALGVVVLALWACSDFSLDLGDSGRQTQAEAKHVQSYNPFAGLDEAGYAKGIGSPEAVETYLEIFAKRLAQLMDNPDVRQKLADSLTVENGQEANLAEIALSHPTLLSFLGTGFKAAVEAKKLTGELAQDATTEAITDQDAMLTVAQGLFGLRVKVRSPNDQTPGWDGSNPIPVFHNPITDELDTEWVKGYDPDGTQRQFAFGSRPPYQILYVFQDEEFFDRPGNAPATAAAVGLQYRDDSFFSLTLHKSA